MHLVLCARVDESTRQSIDLDIAAGRSFCHGIDDTCRVVNLNRLFFAIVCLAIGCSEFFNAVATVMGWNKLTGNKAAPDAPTITVSGRNFRINANANDPCGTPLSYSLDNGVTWQAYSGRVNVPGEASVTIKARAIAGNGKISEIATATIQHG